VYAVVPLVLPSFTLECRSVNMFCCRYQRYLALVASLLPESFPLRSERGWMAEVYGSRESIRWEASVTAKIPPLEQSMCLAGAPNWRLGFSYKVVLSELGLKSDLQHKANRCSWSRYRRRMPSLVAGLVEKCQLLRSAYAA
jgi:hypothetical protein